MTRQVEVSGWAARSMTPSPRSLSTCSSETPRSRRSTSAICSPGIGGGPKGACCSPGNLIARPSMRRAPAAAGPTVTTIFRAAAWGVRVCRGDTEHRGVRNVVLLEQAPRRGVCAWSTSLGLPRCRPAKGQPLTADVGREPSRLVALAGDPTLTISAPRSPRNCAASGPASTRVRSVTRRPVSRPHEAASVRAAVVKAQRVLSPNSRSPAATSPGRRSSAAFRRARAASSRSLAERYCDPAPAESTMASLRIAATGAKSGAGSKPSEGARISFEDRTQVPSVGHHDVRFARRGVGRPPEIRCLQVMTQRRGIASGDPARLMAFANR
jgi:hypothetical protein